MKKISSLIRIFSLSAACMFMLVPALLGAEPSTAEVLGEISVQQGGRVKPFETFAREMVMTVTGKTKFKRISPTELVWRWVADPQKWNEMPLIDASYPAVRDLFSPVMVIEKRVSPEVALSYEPLVQKADALQSKQERKEKLSLEEQKIMEVYNRALLFRQIGLGRIPGWIAHPEDPSLGWLSLQAIASPEGESALQSIYPQKETERFRKAIQDLLPRLKEDFYSESARQSAQEFSESLRALFASRGVALNEKVLAQEKAYNRLRCFHWAWLAYLLSACLAIAVLIKRGLVASGELVKQNKNQKFSLLSFASLLIFIAGFVFHSYGFYLRCQIAGRPPVSNMYESVIWVSWGVVLFALILSSFYRVLLIRIFAAAVACMALLIAENFPAFLDPFITPLVPVLRSNLWLTVHVLTITLSYAAFALAWGLGHGAIIGFAFSPQKKELNYTLTLYLYRAVQIGVVLLAAGTVLGGVWANYSWGRFWGWDPKETWALIALLGYLAVLHGRFSGWMGPFGFAVGCVVAFLGILMAWYGVNYVLAAGLHSYGFGGGGLPYVASVVGLDLLFVLASAFLYKQKYRKIPVS